MSLKVNLGCGPFYKNGWINVDIKKWDPAPDVILNVVTQEFPWRDVDYFYLGHLLVSITYEECLYVLNKCYASLKQGGKIRIAESDFNWLLSLYYEGKSFRKEVMYKRDLDDVRRGGYEFLSPVHQFWFDIHRWGRKSAFDFNLIHVMLVRSGFVNIMKFKSNQSIDADLKNLEYRNDGGEICVEAEKP